MESISVQGRCTFRTYTPSKYLKYPYHISGAVKKPSLFSNGWGENLFKKTLKKEGVVMVVAEVKIKLKKGVADPEGANTKKTLELLGFSDVTSVKSVKVFEIHLTTENKDQAEVEIKDMCEKLLANPVIHDYSISFS
jgi:phosphoribosylformylglycinamidine synthase